MGHVLALARSGSFMRAAQSLGISQPALSKSIAVLEQRLGDAVVLRGQNGCTLTPLGAVVARRAREFESLLHDTEREMSLRAQGVAGPLHIGATPSLMLMLVRDALCRVSSDVPRLCASVTEALDDTLMEMLLAWKIDLAVGPVGGMYPVPASIVEESLFTEAYAIGVGPRHRRTRTMPNTLAELVAWPWVLPVQGSSYYRHVEALFRNAGVGWPANCLSANSLGLIEEIVMRTDRITIVTMLQARSHNGVRLRIVPLHGGGRRSVGMRYRRGAELSPSATRFMTILREEAASYVMPALT